MKKLNHKGLGLPTVLAISSFLIALSVTLISYVSFQAKVVEFSVTNTENYINAETKLTSTLQALSNSADLDVVTISQITTDFEVTLENVSANLYKISTRLDKNNFLESYFTTSAKKTNTYDTIFYHTGQETTFKLDPIITANSLLVSRYNLFMDEIDPSINLSSNSSFDAVMLSTKNYALSSSTDNHVVESPTTFINRKVNDSIVINNEVVYVTGNLFINNLDLVILGDSILFIEGNLDFANRDSGSYKKNRLNIEGEIISSGSVTIPSYVDLKANIYAKNDFSTLTEVNLGTSLRPSFIFANAQITIGNQSSGYVISYQIVIILNKVIFMLLVEFIITPVLDK